MRAADVGLRVVLLRNGVVLSRSAGILHKLLTPFRLGLGGPAGSGAQWLPWPADLQPEAEAEIHSAAAVRIEVRAGRAGHR